MYLYFFKGYQKGGVPVMHGIHISRIKIGMVVQGTQPVSDPLHVNRNIRETFPKFGHIVCFAENRTGELVLNVMWQDCLIARNVHPSNLYIPEEERE